MSYERLSIKELHAVRERERVRASLARGVTAFSLALCLYTMYKLTSNPESPLLIGGISFGALIGSSFMNTQVAKKKIKIIDERLDILEEIQAVNKKNSHLTS